MSLGMFAAVAAGGALGAVTRYAVSLGVGAGHVRPSGAAGDAGGECRRKRDDGRICRVRRGRPQFPKPGAVSWLSGF